jgi:DNA-binding LytR/AlgR family response regulator
MEALPLGSTQRVHLPFSSQEIILMKGNGGYTEFLPLKGKSVLTCHSLLYYEPFMPEYFVRVHKGYIINLAHVQEVYPQDKTIYMTNGSCIIVPRLKWPLVKELVQQFKRYQLVA